VLLLGILLVSPSVAAPWSMFAPYPPMLITVNPATPRAGETLTIDVYTYRAGVPQDSDDIPRVSVGGGLRGLPPVLERVTVGHYRGSFALPEDNDSYDGRAQILQGVILVATNISRVPTGRYAPVTWFDPGLTARLSVDKPRPSMGDVVAVRAEVLARGTLTDADNISFSLDIASGYHADGIATRRSPGVYTTSFTLPSFSPAYVAVIFHAVANVAGVEARRDMDIRVARYQVWFHQSQSSTTNVRGELWIANETGSPAAGVAIRFYADATLFTGTSDASGAFPVSFDLPSNGQISINGGVGAGTPTENYFVLTVYGPQYTLGRAMPVDPPLLPDGSPRDFVRPGQRVQRAVKLVNATVNGTVVPYSNADLVYYVWTLHEVLEAGHLRTDSAGTARIEFEAPGYDVNVGFLQGDYMIDVLTYRVGSLRVALNVSAVTLGGATRVRATVSPDIQQSLDAQSFLWSSSEVILLNPAPGEGWNQWTNRLGDDLYPAPGGIVHTYGLPAFLPREGRYLFAVSVSRSFEPLTQFTLLKVGEVGEVPLNTTDGGPASPPGGSAEPVVLIGIAVIVLAASASLAVFWFRRRARKPGP